MANVPRGATYKEYEPPPLPIPEHTKTTETTPLLRVKKTPNIVEPENNDPPISPRVEPSQNQTQHEGPHIIPQCNAVYYQSICTVPLHYVNAVYNKETGNMEDCRQLIK
eukprot:8143707-Ditylum_brightwellii.AAC.1